MLLSFLARRLAPAKCVPPSGGHSAPASTMAACTSGQAQQVPASAAATVSPPEAGVRN
jgi:hypothetical protein